MILELATAIKKSIEQSLDDKVAISFSGGLDSSTIATIARLHSDAELFSCGKENCQDLHYAEKIADDLSLPLNKILIDEEKALYAYEKLYSFLPLDFLKLGILVPVYCAAEAAAKNGHSTMLFGAAAEELFVGYDRYYSYHEEGKDLDAILAKEFQSLRKREIAWIRKICWKFDLDARFPFYSSGIAKLVFSVPIEDRMENRELKKGLLRESAKILKVPETAISRNK